MIPKLLPSGKVQVEDAQGNRFDLGPEHPQYNSVLATLVPAAKPDYTRARLLGIVLIVVGIVAWWYHWHTAATEGVYSRRLAFLGPTGVFGGLLLLIRPDWSGRVQKDTSTAQKVGTFGVLALIGVAFGVDIYAIENYPFHPTKNAFTSSAGRPQATTLRLRGNLFLLQSFRATPAPTWEFTRLGEPIGLWTSMITVIDRADAKSPADLDRLAAGIQSNFSSHNARILEAKTLQDDTGAPYHYMVASFDEPAQRRCELNFVKMALGPQHAVVAIYAIRVTGTQDYKADTQQFVEANSAAIQLALARDLRPDPGTLPRKEF